MRNLKRALSLTLASVMLLGMMVVGSSAAGYPDVSEEENIEAIEVLQAVGVMGGDENGNFNPDDYVTREQMAVIMAQLLKLDYNYYKGTNPFSDVPEWAAPYVAACAANGVTAGIGGGLYGSKQNIQAVQAALMMLKALGYFQYPGDYEGGYVLATVKQGSEIGLFNGIDSKADSDLTRNQVAQMALNALKANMVSFTGDPGITYTGSNGETWSSGYKAEYTFRSGTDRKYFAISGQGNTTDGTTNQAYIQLGEQLYDGDLRLNDSTYDDFGRPARYWEYDGTAVGTYAKKELVQETYTAKVTGKTLYDLLGKDLVNLIDGSDSRTRYTLSVTIDGNDDNATHTKVFGKSALSRTNTDAVGGTGNGVLTEVYVDNTARTIDIAIINTYLAIADNDYNEKKDEVSLNIYNLDKDGSLYFKDYKRDGDGDSWRDAENPLKASGEDFNVADVKKDDKFLVTVAAGEIKSVVAPEVVSDQTITSHKTHDYVVADTQYDYAATAQYDTEVMENFSSVDMKDVTYNVVLDKYGYLIGLEQNEKVDEYVFVTGIDDAYSYLSKKNVPANIIHLDGNMETVTMNTRDSSDFGTLLGISGDEFAQVHTWCTYSVDNNGTYTLKKVADVTSSGSPKVKVAQSAMDASNSADGNSDSEIKINSKNISLDGDKDNTNPSYTPVIGKVHGNDNTVYINVEMENVAVESAANRRIVKDVDSITTGVTNVDMIVKDRTKAVEGQNSSGTPTFDVAANEVYTLFKDNGTIIAVVTLEAEDNASTKHYAYINSSDIDHRNYDASAKEYSFYREAIVDGEFVMLKEVDDDTASNYLNTDVMERGKWYEIKYNANGEVRGITAITYPNPDTTGTSPSGHTAPSGTIPQVGTSWMEDSNFVANAIDKTFILNANYTATHPELKYNAGTLYTGNDTTKGVYVSPTAKVVVYTKDYDKHEEYTGAELEKALNSLVNRKAFDGYVNAVIGSDGVATVVILDERNMDAPDTYTVSFIGGENVNIAGTVSGIAKNGTASFTVTPKSGYTVDSVMYGSTPLTPDENGRYTINNITDNINVTINTTKDANAYAGEINFSITGAGTGTATVTATWTGDTAPTDQEIATAMVNWLTTTQNYDKTTLNSLAITADTKVVVKGKQTLAGVPQTEDTITLTYAGGGLTQTVEVTDAADLATAMSTVGTNGKVVLKDSATVAAKPTCAIEVAAGKTLTVSSNVALDKAIAGAGSVAFEGDVTDGVELIAVTGGISVATGKALTVDAAWTIPSDITGAGSITATQAITNGDKIKVTGGLTLGASSSIDKINNTVDVTVSGNTEIKGAATPKTLTQTSGAITVAATGKLTLPSTFTTVNDDITATGELILTGNITIAAGKKITVSATTGTIDFANKTISGADNTADFVIGSGATVKNFTASSQNFYDSSNNKLNTDNAIAAGTYDWDTSADGNSTAGWKAS